MLSSFAITTTTSPITVFGSFLLLGILPLLVQQGHKEFTIAQNLNKKLRVISEVVFIGVIPFFLAFLLVMISHLLA